MQAVITCYRWSYLFEHYFLRRLRISDKKDRKEFYLNAWDTSEVS